ncbi:MAG: Ribosomal protein [Candidatus Parcubacteria bacterium]|jgi:ribosomal protein S6
MQNENESMMDDNQIYEISYIFDGRLDADKASAKAESLKKDIASLEGSFISEETPYLRELSYEMTRVVNNVNVRFSEGYFGWIKSLLPASKIEELNKKLKLDEEVVRFLILKAEKGNDVFTKDKPIVKSDPTIASFVREEISGVDVNIDTTTETMIDPVEGSEVLAGEVSETIPEEKENL